MLTIIAGEDTAASRNKLQQLKEAYRQKGYAIQSTTASDVPDILKNMSGVTNLFGQEAIYIVDNLSSKYKGRKKTPFKEAVQALATTQDIHLIDWEEGKSAYELSALKRIADSFDEYKPEKNIFELLEACYPGNLNVFLQTLDVVNQTQDMMFIYTLLWRHVRKLILAGENALDAKTAPWQRQKMQNQAGRWKQPTLLKFYEGLARIDTAMKTNGSSYDLKQSIELLVCYYLK